MGVGFMEEAWAAGNLKTIDEGDGGGCVFSFREGGTAGTWGGRERVNRPGLSIIPKFISGAAPPGPRGRGEGLGQVRIRRRPAFSPGRMAETPWERTFRPPGSARAESFSPDLPPKKRPRPAKRRHGDHAIAENFFPESGPKWPGLK
jgi:hypothetical protein